MKTVYKYPLVAGRSTITLPKGAKLLCVREQFNQPTLWVLVEDVPMSFQRHIWLVPTGQLLPELPLVYIDTVLLNNGAFVLHAFEEVEAAFSLGGVPS